MTVYDIMGNELVSVPVTPKCERVQELMRTDCVKLSWVSEESTKLPAGAYVEYEGEHFTLLNDYSPVPRTEREYAYEPVFESVVMEWTKVPFFMYNASTKESDWALTASPSVFLERVALALREETGKTYSIATSIGGSTSLQFSSTDIFSALNSIAQAFNTEWWLDKTTNTLHLGSCEHGATITLEVGKNVGAPSVSESSEGFYNRFYVFGSTRNIVQSYEGANVNNLVNKRLTLDPSEFPNGYYEPYGSQPKVFSKILVFDDIYPAATNLKVVDLVARTAYNLDDNGNKKQVGTDSNGNAIYDQYTTWFFKAALEKEDGSYEDFIYNDWTYTEDPSVENGRQGMKIAGLVPSVKFESGLLMGREFEVTYYSKNTTISTVEGSIVVPAGFFGINYVKEGDYIIPDQFSLFPTEGDKVVFFNIKMPDIYITDAYARLKEKMLSTIQEKYLSDQNQYTLRSYPHAFNESISVGSKVKYIWGGRELNTRVTALTNRLDYPSVKEITIGNTLTKGTIQQLIDETASANMNLEIMANMNAMTSSLANAYDRAHQITLEMLNSLGDLFVPHYDKDGKLESIEAKVSLWSNGEITALGQGTGGSGGGGGEGGADLLDVWISIAGNSDSFKDYQVNPSHLTAYLTRAQIQETYATKEDLENIDIPTLTESDPIFKASAAYGITTADISNWNSKTSNIGTITGIKMNGVSKGTSGEVDLGTVITEHQSLADYALKSDLTALSTQVATLSGNLQGYAGDLQNVREDVDGIMGDYITQSKLDSAIAGITGGDGSLGNRVDSLEAAVVVLEGYVPDDIAEGDAFASQQWVLSKNYALKSDIPTIPSLSGYATQQWVLDRGYLTSASLDGLEQAIDNNATDIGDHENRIATIEDNYAQKSAIPTSLSDLSNDVGYITSAALGGLASESWVSNNFLGLGGGTISGNLDITGYFKIKSHYFFVRDNDNADWLVTDKNWQHEYTLIHSGNIGSQSVNYANSAGSAQSLVSAKYGHGFALIYEDDMAMSFGQGLYDVYIDGKTLHFRNENYVDVMTIARNGNVGIGTTDPQYKLDVNGLAKFKGIYTPYAATFNKLCESYSSYEINQMANVTDGAPSGYPYGYLTTYRWNDGSWSGQMYLTVADYGGEIFTRGFRDDQGKWTIWRKAFLDDGYGNFTASESVKVSNIEYLNLRGFKSNNSESVFGFHDNSPIILSHNGVVRFGITDYNSNVWYQFNWDYSTKNLTIKPSEGTSMTTNFTGDLNVSSDLVVNGYTKVQNVYIGASSIALNRNSDVGGRFDTSYNGWQFHNEGNNMVVYTEGVNSGKKSIWHADGTFQQNGNITASGEITALGSSSSSDRRLKDIVSRPTPLTLEDIAKLNIISFKWNHRENDKRLKIGLVAQEVQEILPELVGVDRSNYLTLDYSTFGGVVGVMNTKRILSLEEEVIALKKEVKELRRKIYG